MKTRESNKDEAKLDLSIRPLRPTSDEKSTDKEKVKVVVVTYA